MNYEDFREEYVALSARLAERLAAQKRLSARLNKALDKGDIRAMTRDMTALNEASAEAGAMLENLRETLAGFDAEEYIEGGHFAEQFVALCEEEGVDIRESETSGTYEVFPYRVKIDAQDVLVNRKKAATFRPRALVETLAKGRAKLLGASFNPAQFLSELSAAYDLCALVTAKGKPAPQDPDLYLSSVYKYLTPMRRFRREYDMQAYAFDLARLYAAEPVKIPDGRAFQFGPSRNNSRAIRILDGAGQERFLATIRFFEE